MMANKKKILVTGGGGLVGSELIRQLLTNGQEIIATKHQRALPKFNSPLVTEVTCDLLDIDTLCEIMQDVDKVFHCAAVVSFHPADKEKLFKVNVEGTANIINAALEMGIEKLVHVSSVATLNRSADGIPVNELAPWKDDGTFSRYSKSKYLGELEVWRGCSEGLDAVIVNPSVILGPGDWNNGSSQIFKTIHDGFAWYSEGVNGFVDVRDVAKAMIALMNSEITGERFILNAENKSYRELFEMIATALHKKAPHKKVTPLLAKLVWRLEAIKSIFTGKKPLVTKESAQTALSKTFYSNEKLKSALPDFQFIALKETIDYTCAQFLKELQ